MAELGVNLSFLTTDDGMIHFTTDDGMIHFTTDDGMIHLTNCVKKTQQ
jgi:hypothetical protein